MTQTSSVPTLPLNTGARIPQLGFGVFQVPPDETVEPVRTAIEAGYRSIDTAAAYRNEEGVGRAIREAGVPRDELYITTKLWNSDQGYEPAHQAFDQSLERLGLDHVDLYLIHWPMPQVDRYLDTWRALEEIHASGRARAIGVSNFRVTDLQRVLEAGGVVPAVNQIELHPRLQQAELRAFHEQHGILTEAWSPLAKGGDLLQDATLGAIAQAHGKTVAQVILRWHVQLGNVVIPKSVTPERIRSNIEVFDFALSEDQMAQIAGLERGERTGPDPATLNAGG
jgi:2,5-diketo-D-gluconate reductase A